MRPNARTTAAITPGGVTAPRAPPAPRALGVLGALGLLGALAAPSQADTAPCVFRDSTIVRPIHAVGLDAKALSFCTGADCWALDLAAHTFASSSVISSGLAEAEADRMQALARSHADDHSATFCRAARSPCRTFRYAFRREMLGGASLAMNADASIGTVTLPLHQETAVALVPLTLIFDLVHGGELGRFRGGSSSVHILGSMIFADGKIFDARGNHLHTYRGGPSDVPPVLVGRSLVASVRLATGQLALYDLTTRTERVIELGFKSSTGQIAALVASSDGQRLYAIAGWPYEGEVLAIDAGTGAITSRRSPMACRVS